MTKKIYLAGPDVFRADPMEYFAGLKKTLAVYGLEGVCPLDSKAIDPFDIYEVNVRLIKKCDGVLANLVPFRGPSLDPGTAFEIGYALALDKVVVGYNRPNEPYLARASRCETYPRIENFGLYDNLMIARSIQSFATANIAISCLSKLLEAQNEQQ